MTQASSAADRTSQRQRWRLLLNFERNLEPLMVLLGFLWLGLLILEYAWTVRPWMTYAANVIWLTFVGDFLVRFVIAPRKILYLRKNWLTIIALALPALRIFRLARALRLLHLTRGLRLMRLITSFNRSLKALGRTMTRRGIAYVAALTGLVIVAGAAGMYAFEKGPAGQGFTGYLEALWWTAMIVTTMGSEFWPQTPEGRLLCLVLSAYAVGVFTYLAGTLASFFIDQDAASSQSEVPSDKALHELRAEITALREEIRAGQKRG